VQEELDVEFEAISIEPPGRIVATDFLPRRGLYDKFDVVVEPLRTEVVQVFSGECSAQKVCTDTVRTNEARLAEAGFVSHFLDTPDCLAKTHFAFKIANNIGVMMDAVGRVNISGPLKDCG
jgi:hypothetical protein